VRWAGVRRPWVAGYRGCSEPLPPLIRVRGGSFDMATLPFSPHLSTRPPLPRLRDGPPVAPGPLCFPSTGGPPHPFHFHFYGSATLSLMAGGGQMPANGRLGAPRIQARTMTPVMGPDYDQSLDLRCYTTASAPGLDGDAEITVVRSVPHVDPAASASGAARPVMGATFGDRGGPGEAPNQGIPPYAGVPAYLSGPPAVYASGYSFPCALPPSAPGSLAAEKRVPLVAPRFGGNNYSTVPATGYNGRHASARGSAGVPSNGVSNVSARLLPAVSPSPAPAAFPNRANVADAVGGNTGILMRVGGAVPVAPAIVAAAAAVGTSEPLFPQAPSQLPFVTPHSQPSRPPLFLTGQCAAGVHVGRDASQAATSAQNAATLPAVRSQSLSISMPPPPAPLPTQQSMPPPAAPRSRRDSRTTAIPPSSALRRPALSSSASKAAAVPPAANAAVNMGVKHKAGSTAGLADASKRRKGAGGRTTAARRSSTDVNGGTTPIDVDKPCDHHPQGQLLVIGEDDLNRVVAAAVAPMRKDIAMTRGDVKEMLSEVGEMRRTVDSQGHAIDRMAGGLTSVNSKIEEGIFDLRDRKTTDETAWKLEPERAAMLQKLALADKNYKNMDAARSVFKDNMKNDMGLTDVSTRVYPSGAASDDDSVRALKEVLGMIDREATSYALSVRTFPKRDKNTVKEARVSALIVSSKSHFSQELKTKILAAWCPGTGVKLPAKRTRKVKGPMKTGKAASKTSRKTSEAAKQAQAIAADQSERAQAAKAWLKDEAYSKNPEGFNGLMASVEAELIFLGAPERVVHPKAVGETKYICCTMGHVALPSAIIRDYLEKETGTRSRRRCGVADGMYEQFAMELKRVHKWLPTDGELQQAGSCGLLLVDGASKDPCKFSADRAEAVAKARPLISEENAAAKARAASDSLAGGSPSDENGELEEEELDEEDICAASGLAVRGEMAAGTSASAADEPDENDSEDSCDDEDDEGDDDVDEEGENDGEGKGGDGEDDSKEDEDE